MMDHGSEKRNNQRPSNHREQSVLYKGRNMLRLLEKLKPAKSACRCRAKYICSSKSYKIKGMEHFLESQCSKSARSSGQKQMCKSKSQKSPAKFLDVHGWGQIEIRRVGQR